MVGPYAKSYLTRKIEPQTFSFIQSLASYLPLLCRGLFFAFFVGCFGARSQQAGRRYAVGLTVRSALQATLRFAFGLA